MLWPTATRCYNAAIFHLSTGSTEAGAVRRTHRATGCLAAVELCGWQLVVAIRAVEAIIEVGGSAAEAVDEGGGGDERASVKESAVVVARESSA